MTQVFLGAASACVRVCLRRERERIKRKSLKERVRVSACAVVSDPKTSSLVSRVLMPIPLPQQQRPFLGRGGGDGGDMVLEFECVLPLW